ncbi:MAG: hypothetical protein HYV00_13035 [Deltaproteobacteria bacterium]|nr:hypothetical protein [Deltaproteobacteria bacterium]
MRIERVETFPVNVPLKEAYVMSKTSSSSISALIIRLSTDSGIEGIGEARVGLGNHYTHESIESMKLMVDKYFGPALMGENPLDINNLIEKVNAAWAAGYTITKAGIEMALFDIMGKHYKLSVSDLLGGTYKNKKVGLVGAVNCAQPLEMAKEAAYWAGQGRKVLKAKIGQGADVELDTKRVSEMRAAIGPNADLRLDCNHAYRIDTALRLIKRVEKYDPCLLEDPIERWNIEGMVQLTRISAVPICIDNYIFSPQDAFHVLSKGACHVIKIKLQRVGGFRNALQIIAVADSAGIPVTVGQAAVLNISAAAEYHLIAASKSVVPWGENEPALKQESDVVKNPLQIKDGHISLPTSSGLGVELDMERVTRFSMPLP